MKNRTVPSLAERSLAIRAKLGAQRAQLALDLDPASAALRTYPRSVTMRLLTERPELLGKLASLVIGARLADRVALVLWLLRILRPPRPIDARMSVTAPSPDQTR